MQLYELIKLSLLLFIRALPKKVDSLRSKVNTRDILRDWNSTDADSDAPLDPVDNTEVRSSTPAKKAAQKSNTKTPIKTGTTEEVRVTRSQTPKVKNKQPRISTGRQNTPESTSKRSRTPKSKPQQVEELAQNQDYHYQMDDIELRPLTPAHSPPGRVTRSRTPGKQVSPGRAEEQLITPRREDVENTVKDENKQTR